MNAPDILEYIRAALITAEPLTITLVEQTIKDARRTYGGDTIYIRAPARDRVTRRTLQNRRVRAK